MDSRPKHEISVRNRVSSIWADPPVKRPRSMLTAMQIDNIYRQLSKKT